MNALQLEIRNSRHFAWALLGLGVLTLGFATGCRSDSKAAVEGRQEGAVSADPDPQRAPNMQLPPPAAIAQSVGPLSGEELNRARMGLEAIVEQLPVPAYLQAAEPRPAGPRESPEPSLAALKHYIHGRSLFLHDEYRRAAEQLELAQRIDPRSPQVLRLLGMAYLAQRNYPLGTRHLSAAVRLDPGDSESLFLLGSSAFKRRAWDEAIVALARVNLSAPRSEPAIAYLRPYYLGQALLQRGYLAAATDQLARYLRTPVRFGQVPRLYAEAALLDRQRGRIEQEVGDLLCRLGRFEEALEHYARAADDPELDPDALAARRVYAFLVTHRPRQAEQVLVERLGAAGATPDALSLTSYLAEHTGDQARLAELLRSYYQRADRPGPLAVAVAELLPTQAAADLLAEHLIQRPDDEPALHGLIERLLPEQTARLVRVLSQLIREHPSSARRYVQALFQHDPPVDALLRELDSLPEDQRQTAAAHYLRGAAHEHARRIDAAAAAYDQAFEADPSFLSPQLANVELQLRLRRHDRALRLLERLPDSPDPVVGLTRARLYAIMGQPEAALKLLDGLIEREPRNTEYRLQKAVLEKDARRYEEAERTLAAVLDIDRTNERAFELLFQIIEEDGSRGGGVQTYRLLQRAAETIPASPVTRYWTALYEARRGRIDQARAILESLVEREPGNARALDALTQVHQLEGKHESAVNLLLSHAKRRPNDPEPLRVLVRVLANDEQGHYEPFLPRIAQELTLEQATRLHYSLSLAYQLRGKTALAERELARVLEIDPQHISAHNDLGYLWADQGKNLDRALELTRKAVEADPNQSAYLDSLGWVYYKLGDFATAAEHLRKARALEGGDNPVILDHLGDALWRLGEKEDARKQWADALEEADGPENQSDLESAKVRASVQAKLKALSENAEPPVAEVGTKIESQKSKVQGQDSQVP